VSKSNGFENELLEYAFKGTAFPWHSATQWDVHLHTADPGEGGVSTTSEATYTGYAPITKSRSATDWTVTGSTVTNATLFQFPQCTGGSNTITYISLTPAGTTAIKYSGAISSPLAVSNLIQPQLAPGAFTLTED
jgi:hypothetical protein